MDLGIAGKNVLVTGASQGIGRATAIDFAKEGCRVAVVARRVDRLQELLNEMGGEGRGHTFWAIDLMEEGAPTRVIRALTAHNRSFDIVVHNLGGTLNVKDPLSPLESWFKVWRYNVGVAIEINALVVPPMIERQWGRIIHISSISAQSLRGSAPYAAAKAYVNAYATTLGRDLAPKGVVVSALMPGAIMAEGGHWDQIRKTNPSIMADFLRHHHAIGRFGTPEEISPFALFMASQYATFAPGAVIPIDGGTM